MTDAETLLTPSTPILITSKGITRALISRKQMTAEGPIMCPNPCWKSAFQLNCSLINVLDKAVCPMTRAANFHRLRSDIAPPPHTRFKWPNIPYFKNIFIHNNRGTAFSDCRHETWLSTLLLHPKIYIKNCTWWSPNRFPPYFTDDDEESLCPGWVGSKSVPWLGVAGSLGRGVITDLVCLRVVIIYNSFFIM